MLHDYPDKIRLVQIEDGDRIRELIDTLEDLKYQLGAIKDSKLIEKINQAQQNYEKLLKDFEDYKNVTNTNMNKLANDIYDEIEEIRKELENCRKKDEPISLDDLDMNLRDLIADMRYKLDFITSNIDNIPDIGDQFPDDNYTTDKDGIKRLVKWEVPFVASTFSTIPLLSIDGFHDDLTKVISNTDFYGPNYEEGDFSNALVEIKYLAPLDYYLTDEQRQLPLKERIAAAYSEAIESDREWQYVPRTNIDDKTYEKIEYFKSAIFDEESNLITFANVSTTYHLFKVVKFFK